MVKKRKMDDTDRKDDHSRKSHKKHKSKDRKKDKDKKHKKDKDKKKSKDSKKDKKHSKRSRRSSSSGSSSDSDSDDENSPEAQLARGRAAAQVVRRIRATFPDVTRDLRQVPRTSHRFLPWVDPTALKRCHAISHPVSPDVSYQQGSH